MKINYPIKIFSRYRQSLLLQRRIRCWKSALTIHYHEDMYQKLFIHVNGFTISRQMRTNYDAMEYVYGEIDFISFIALLSLTRPNQDTVFYDFGSGVGKTTLSCAMIFDVKKSCGIELFSELHLTAIKQRGRLAQLPLYAAKMQVVHFINDNFLYADFDDATLVFINASALFGETWNLLNQRLAKLAQGALVITTSKQLISEEFVATHMTKVQMSWGVVRAFIQQKL